MALAGWLVTLGLSAWVAQRLGRRGSAWAAIAAWLSLPIYNAWILSSCPGDCGIRVDLVLVVPVLLTLTFVAIWRWMRARRLPR